MANPKPERDDALQFSSLWMRGEKRYQLGSAYVVTEFPQVALPEGVAWEEWYGKRYLFVVASVLSGRKWMGLLPVGRKFVPIVEGLAPVVTEDGKRGWYRFFKREKGLNYRVQFFPEAKSSRSEVEFHWESTDGEPDNFLKAETHGGAVPLESFPDPAFFYKRYFYLEEWAGALFMTPFEHQNRMAWEAEKFEAKGLKRLLPKGLAAEESPEMTYVAKGSTFAEGLPKRCRRPS